MLLKLRLTGRNSKLAEAFMKRFAAFSNWVVLDLLQTNLLFLCNFLRANDG